MIATTKSAKRFGGVGNRPPRRTETSHDLHLAALYLRLHEENPERASNWLSEDILVKQRKTRRERAQPLPDALVMENQTTTVIEMGGASYTAEKLYRLHDYCEAEGFGYELW